MSKKAKPKPDKTAKPEPELDERKDKVLQARVPQSLYDDLTSKARRLRIPVSNLVRNILEDSIRMVENIVDSGLDIAQALGSKVTERDLNDVLGWQPMVANRAVPCSRCSTHIEQGDSAYIAVGAPEGKTIVLCDKCGKGR